VSVDPFQIPHESRRSLLIAMVSARPARARPKYSSIVRRSPGRLLFPRGAGATGVSRRAKAQFRNRNEPKVCQRVALFVRSNSSRALGYFLRAA
jgi:hypothetical protein